MIVALLAFDLPAGQAPVRPHAVGYREAAAWSAFYIAVAVVFGPLRPYGRFQSWTRAHAGRSVGGYQYRAGVSDRNRELGGQAGDDHLPPVRRRRR